MHLKKLTKVCRKNVRIVLSQKWGMVVIRGRGLFKRLSKRPFEESEENRTNLSRQAHNQSLGKASDPGLSG